jgi:uridine kinase
MAALGPLNPLEPSPKPRLGAEGPLVIGIAGGSGSGKTTLARALRDSLHGRVVILEQDHYYRSLAHLSAEERDAVNFDHPSAVELELLCAHLDALKTGNAIERPTYNFTVHDREPQGLRVEPHPVVIVEGIMVLVDEALRKRLHVKIFVDTDADIRLMRRVRRDLEERGRSFSAVRTQYHATVRPMHLAFVEPSKRFADLIVPEGGDNLVALRVLESLVRERVAEGAG